MAGKPDRLETGRDQPRIVVPGAGGQVPHRSKLRRTGMAIAHGADMKELSVHHPYQTRPESEGDPDAALMRRISTLIDGVARNCACRKQLNQALASFSALEHRRMLHKHLAHARQQRERIKAILDFLQEIDELVPSEPDQSVHTELALLFEEVAAIAAEGAASMHRLAALATLQGEAGCNGAERSSLMEDEGGR